MKNRWSNREHENKYTTREHESTGIAEETHLQHHEPPLCCRETPVRVEPWRGADITCIALPNEGRAADKAAHTVSYG